jgi:dTDP-4-amino-4,6-dideoxygalactose transaminase
MKKNMKKNDTYYFGQPDIGKEELRAVTKVLASKWVTFGSESIELEKELISYTNATDGVIVNSCTAALHLALILRGVKPGDEIITTPLTFAATANTILMMGAIPVFVDIKRDTLNIDETKIAAAITPRTKGIVVVHFGGLPCDMKKINAIAKKHKLFVNEDAAHALGAKVNGKMVGDSSNLTCFSFYANKNLTTVDGGFLATGNKSLALRGRSLRLHGLSNDAWNRFHNKKKLVFEVTELGYKYNLNDVHAAIGRVQLKKFSKNQQKRTAHGVIYDRILSGVKGITLQPKHINDTMTVHALHLYTIVIDPLHFKRTRDELVEELRARGIFAVVHYLPLHEHMLYRERFGFSKNDFPVARDVGENIMSIPLVPQFTKKEAYHIAKTVRDVLNEFYRE